jgi:hypothetical protein
MSEVEQPGNQPDEEYIPLPPASFDWLVISLRAQAEMHLGLMHFGPESERPKPKLELARHSIDMLAMLQDKTRGNLTLEEQRLLENSLTELRFRYVQAYEESRQGPPAQAESQQA